MDRRAIPAIDHEPRVLALGCWQFGGQWVGQDDADSLAALARAAELGFDHWDTAQGYGDGHSEQLVGRALKQIDQPVVLASKQLAMDTREMIAAVETSLARLGVDVIDLFYIHWPRQEVDLRRAMEGLEKCREQGKLKAIGVSNFSVEDMDLASEVGRIDAHQMNYSLLWRFPETAVLPYCREHDIAVVTYSSIAQGILAGKFGREPDLPEGDLRWRTVWLEDAVWPAVWAGVERMKAVALAARRPLAHLAMQWVAAQPGVTSVIVGARNADQVARNAEAMDPPVDPARLDELTAISNEILPHIPAEAGNLWRASW